jgi:hypothetical protein
MTALERQQSDLPSRLREVREALLLKPLHGKKSTAIQMRGPTGSANRLSGLMTATVRGRLI